MVFQPPLRSGMPSYTALYPALRRKQPPLKSLNFCWRSGWRKDSLIVKIDKRELARLQAIEAAAS